ncbi:MAG: hypothetical protein KDI63_00615 [Gammaproteobacteria bacterium]|nr:hypothetical protein [Gammaproteobacteria bacterium]
MSDKRFSLGNYMIRLLMALIVVFATYNPTGKSWLHWFLQTENRLDPLLILCGIVLLIGWVIFLRSTLRSLGALGTLLAIAFFAALVWLLISYDLLSLNNTTALSYVILVVIAAIIATGMSWSHIRRRLSGQLDVDDVEEG